MHILIADDFADVVENFAKAIAKLGHTPIRCATLRQACDVIQDPTKHIDIAYIDNHFGDEGFGIDRVREFRSQKPDMDIVVTTKRDVRPDLVGDILQMEVGFFKKQSDDPILLEAEISQRVNVRRTKEEAFRRKIAELQNAAASGGEGVWRLLHFVKGSDKKRKLVVESVERRNERIVVPRFAKFQTIHVGQRVEITDEFEFDCSEQLKAATSMELGLGIEESLKFFTSKLGIQIKEKLRSEHAVEERRKLRGLYRRGQTLSLTDDDIRRKIRRREYYRGIDHEIYRIIVRSSCGHCGIADSIGMRVFVPVSVIEVSVAFDKQGFRVPGEDGREAYRQLLP